MKTLILSTILIVTSSIARADAHQMEQVNFNQEIDQNTASAQDLSKDLSAAMVDQKVAPSTKEAKVEPTQDEKDGVTNFVDFEIQSVGQEKPAKQAVNRRYNSVEEPEVKIINRTSY